MYLSHFSTGRISPHHCPLGTVRGVEAISFQHAPEQQVVLSEKQAKFCLLLSASLRKPLTKASHEMSEPGDTRAWATCSHDLLVPSGYDPHLHFPLSDELLMNFWAHLTLRLVGSHSIPSNTGSYVMSGAQTLPSSSGMAGALSP